MTQANERQVGGDHYRKVEGEQHWDRLVRLKGLEKARAYFVGNITAYVERYEDKNGVQDLEKARHYLDKLIELETHDEELRRYATGVPAVTTTPTNDDGTYRPYTEVPRRRTETATHGAEEEPDRNSKEYWLNLAIPADTYGDPDHEGAVLAVRKFAVANGFTDVEIDYWSTWAEVVEMVFNRTKPSIESGVLR